ncbi:MAG: hypothetical protein JWQ47_2559 [Glaciihabitans sp.]|nr:hypothetical protein [Glaciihabitans sp.]
MAAPRHRSIRRIVTKSDDGIDVPKGASPESIDGVEIFGDPTHLWAYAWYGIVLAFILAVGVVVFDRGGGRWYDVPATVLGTPAIFGLVLGGVCLSWKRRVLPVSYRITADSVAVLRHGIEVASYPHADIRSATFVGVMDYRAILTRWTYNPDWPHLRLEVTRGADLQRIDLPEIMIWGRDQIHEAERVVRATLRL